MKKLAMLFCLCVLVSAPAFAATEMNTTASVFGKNAERIRRIEAYLSGITTIIAEFTQAAPDGSLSNGKFFMKRPGLMRWQYNPPTPILIISDGKALTYYDYELEQVSNIPLDSSLIGFLAREKIEFSGSVAVESFSEEGGAIRVTLAQVEKPSEGKLMLEFSDNPLLLRNMVVTDASGQVTTVSLQKAQFGQKLSKDLFVFRDPRKRKKT